MQTKTSLNQTELAARWTISARTLERWRWTGDGPALLKIGGRVVYRLEDVLAYEQARQRRSTAVRCGHPASRQLAGAAGGDDRSRNGRFCRAGCRYSRC